MIESDTKVSKEEDGEVRWDEDEGETPDGTKNYELITEKDWITTEESLANSSFVHG